MIETQQPDVDRAQTQTVLDAIQTQTFDTGTGQQQIVHELRAGMRDAVQQRKEKYRLKGPIVESDGITSDDVKIS